MALDWGTREEQVDLVVAVAEATEIFDDTWMVVSELVKFSDCHMLHDKTLTLTEPSSSENREE